MPNVQLDIAAVETGLADFRDPETGRYGMDLDQIASNATKRNARNVFDEIIRDGHDEQFVPMECDSFVPSDLAAGTPDKIELLRQRVEMGVPLWHERDRADFENLVGVIRPRSP